MAPSLLALAVAPAFLHPGRESPKWKPASSLLVFTRAQSFVLWAHQVSLCSIRAFHGKGCCCCFNVSLAIPQFGLLCHISPLRLSSWHSSPVLTLRTNDATYASLTSPHSLLVDTSIWAPFPLVIADRPILCGCFHPNYFALWGFKAPHWHTCERVSCCLETYRPWLPPQDWAPSLNPLSLFSSFIFCPTSFQRDWAAFLGVWSPPPAFSGFVEVVPYSNDLSKNL